MFVEDLSYRDNVIKAGFDFCLFLNGDGGMYRWTMWASYFLICLWELFIDMFLFSLIVLLRCVIFVRLLLWNPKRPLTSSITMFGNFMIFSKILFLIEVFSLLSFSGN